MPRIQREASVAWEGSLSRGTGTMTAGRARSSYRSISPSRIERVAEKTSPEELLAAAHGGCFATSLPTSSRGRAARSSGSMSRAR